MSSHKIQLMNKHRKKPRKRFTFKPPVSTLSIFVATGFIFMLMLAFAFFTIYTLDSQPMSMEIIENQSSSDSSVKESLALYFPKIVSMWPKDENDQDFLSSCDLDDSCHRLGNATATHSSSGKVVYRAILARPPSVINLIMQDLIQDLLANQSQLDIEMIPVPRYDFKSLSSSSSSSVGNVVRLASLPILLDAMDLGLQAAESNDQLTLEDFLKIVRLLTEWHCYHNHVAKEKDISLISYSSQQVLLHASSVRGHLMWFISQSYNGQAEAEVGAEATAAEQAPTTASQNNQERSELWRSIWLDPVSTLVIERVDECSRAASRLQTLNPAVDVQALAKKVTQQEMERCKYKRLTSTTIAAATLIDNPAKTTIEWFEQMFKTLEQSASSTSRLVKIAQILLSTNDSALQQGDSTSSSMCSRFPLIGYCRFAQNRVNDGHNSRTER